MKFSRKGICICAIAVGIIASVSTAFSVFTLTGVVYKNNPLNIKVINIELEEQNVVKYDVNKSSGLKYSSDVLTCDSATYSFTFDWANYRDRFKTLIDDSVLMVDLNFNNLDFYKYCVGQINNGYEFLTIKGDTFIEGTDSGWFTITTNDLYSFEYENNIVHEKMISFDDNLMKINYYIPFSSDKNSSLNIKSIITVNYISEVNFDVLIDFNIIPTDSAYSDKYSIDTLNDVIKNVNFYCNYVG